MKVINVWDYEPGIDEAIQYIHGAWGNSSNYMFYEDAIKHSSLEGKAIPRFYVMVNEDNKIIGCCGLITNDFISRHDLYPWLSSVYVSKEARGNEYGNQLMEFALKDAKQFGFDTVYLTTDHDGFYERYGWERIEDGIDLGGDKTRIYKKQTK